MLNNITNTKRLCFVLVLLTLFVAGCGQSSNKTSTQQQRDGKTPVTLQLGWFPGPENGGIYAAIQQGYYEEAGLDVTIAAGGPHMSAIQILASDGATFATEKADTILLARQRGIPVVAVATTNHTSPQSLLFHTGQSIETFYDIDGRTVFFVPGIMGYEYVVNKFDLSLNEQVHSGSFGAFINDETSLLHGFASSESCHIDDIDALLFADAGYNTYENIIVTTEKIIEQSPEIVEAFVTATVAGWHYYEHHATEVNELILEERPEADSESFACQATLQASYIYGEEANAFGLGYMRPERWEQLRDQLIEIDQLTPDAPYEDAFTNRFLPEQV